MTRALSCIRTGIVQSNELYGDEGTPIQYLRWGKWLKTEGIVREILHKGQSLPITV
jgi:hypothetical protein